MQISYTYDNLDRVVLENNDTTTYEYLYDSEGNLAKKVDKSTGKAVNYQYDSLGRLIHSYQSDGSTIVQRTEHIYDTSNRISSQSWQLGDTTYSESYAYDADDGSLLSLTGAGGVVSYSFGYDALKRLAYRYNYYFRQDYTYRDISSGSQTTTQVSSIAYSQRTGGTNFSTFTLGYTYDKLGNISKVTGTNNTAQNASYTYDQQGQLTKEVNANGTYNYTYDTYGNIRSVSGKESHTYTYGNSEWLDLLTAYDDHSISYDAIGNPTNWYNTKAWNFTWQNGRQLAKATSGNTTVSYTYDVAGIRDSKTVGSTVYNYLTQNGKVVQQSWNGNVMDFIYDENGRPYACIYKDALYYYVLNLQGDVIGLVNTSGAYVAKYTYDAWGRLLSGTGTMASTNPLRYRGYYYDNDTKLYYLGSRYYDPQVKRFINADGLVSTGQDFTGYNMYAYCNNNPVNYVDVQGTIAASIALATTNLWNPIGWIAAAGVVIEGIVITGCIIAITHEALQQAHDTPAQTKPTSPNYASKSSGKQQTKTKSVSSSSAASASPQPPRNNKNGKDNKYRGGTLYNKAGVRIDYEYYGNGNGNVHIHINGNKYYFRPSTGQFVDSAGRVAPKAIQNLGRSGAVSKAVLKGFRYISG